MSTHETIHENLDAYLAGGLTPAERADIEAHIEICAECAQTVKESRQLEETMNEVFAKDRPDAALEERAIAKLRQTRIKRATAWRFIGAAAAVLLFGLVGAALQALAFSDVMKATSGPVAQNKLGDWHIRSYVTGPTASRDSSGGFVDVEPGQFDAYSDVHYEGKRIAEVSVPGSLNPSQAVGIRDGDEKAAAVNLPSPAGVQTRGKGRTNDLPAHENDLLTKLNRSGGLPGSEALSLKDRIDPNDLTGINAYPPALGIIVRAPSREHTSITGGIVGGRSARAEMAAALEKTNASLEWAIPRIQERMPSDGATDLAVEKRLESWSGQAAGMKVSEAGYDQHKTDETIKQRERSSLLVLNSPTYGYYTPVNPGKTEPAKPRGPLPVGDLHIPQDVAKMENVQKKPEEMPKPEPGPADRKIVRTGDIEFEIDSFDKAAATVRRLIGAVKGGFISTRNSDQLPNGKTKGSIVVRMPPEHLDKFIADLRAELTKVGTLRSERVASQDVTKQYTDTEGELKAARVVEGRLIEIIKTRKGDVKDLVAAEHELGNWRTKIEKMEGEIRYYKNQIALSTLTIALVEKEIRAASALIITDHVKMRIEVEHVVQAHKAALKALADVKGHVTKSELKQYKAGQLEAILIAEVPPAQKDAFRDQLKTLGIVSEHEETQRQQAEGGTGKAPGLKPQVNDVQFEVALNNIVNIQPRHSVTLQVATTDVQGNYAKLQDAIRTIAKGQIRDAKISEKDKQNASAVIDFNVPIEEKAAMDKLIAKVGPVLTKSASQVAVTELATDRKFGYVLNLTSVANVPPREVVGLKIEVKDVDKTTAEVKAMVADGKGRIANASVARQENGQVSAALVIEVPLAVSEVIVGQIKKQGNLLGLKTERNPAVPDNNLATAQIIVVVNGVFAGKEPRKKIALRIEVEDVEGKMTDMKEKVKAAKGRVLDEKSGLQTSGQAGAKLVFEVPLAAEDGLVAQFKAAGKKVSYDTQRNTQVPDNDLATAQITVVLAGVSPIVPEDQSYLRRGLSWSFKVFAWCVVAIITGLGAVVPVGVVLLVIYWLIRKIWPSPRAAHAVSGAEAKS